MTKIFEAGTADELWRLAAKDLLDMSNVNLQSSRGGLTREYLHCCLHLENPQQRWVLSRQPAINPAFAIAEVIWILQGSNDATFINFWNPKLPKFSGNQKYYYGAYGKRLKSHFGIDQIKLAYETLLHDSESRQVVLQIWDSTKDLPYLNGKPQNADIPCNIASMLKIRSGKLEWSQIMRSNDLYRGTPYNIIQFTSLQEIIAGWLHLKLGTFSLFTDSLHIYESDIKEIQISDIEPNFNPDSLMLSKSEFDEIFPMVVKYMEKLRSSNLSQEQFNKYDYINQLPNSWKNLLYIAAADSARRKKWFDEMEEAVSYCKNEVLTLAWQNWLERMNFNEKRIHYE